MCGKITKRTQIGRMINHKLPFGFFEYLGKDAEKQRTVLEHFYSVGYNYNYQLAFPCEVGFQDTYLSFGNAATGRSYCFSDLHGNDLMLSADSLATSLRIYANSQEFPKNVRMMSDVPVFRYRKKKYRRWHHLIYNLFNESDEILASYSLITSSYLFLKQYVDKFRYQISFYGIFEELCKYFDISREAMYRELYFKYEKNMATESAVGAIITDIERICTIKNNWRETFNILKGRYSCLEQLLGSYSVYLNLLEKAEIPFNISWTNYHAIEYSSGICFVVFVGDSDKIFADGGSYQYIVQSCYPQITSCYSFACSLEAVANYINNEEPRDVLYLLMMDCSIEFFCATCNKLRENGYFVHEMKVNKSVSKTLKSLPPYSKYLIIGRSEEISKMVKINGKMISI